MSWHRTSRGATGNACIQLPRIRTFTAGSASGGSNAHKMPWEFDFLDYLPWYLEKVTEAWRRALPEVALRRQQFAGFTPRNHLLDALAARSTTRQRSIAANSSTLRLHARHSAAAHAGTVSFMLRMKCISGDSPVLAVRTCAEATLTVTVQGVILIETRCVMENRVGLGTGLVLPY
jgi:hypothetical protein